MNSLVASSSLSDDAKLSAPLPGYRNIDDPLFAENNRKMFQPFVRLGVYSFDDENLCHKSNFVRCNIPNCNKQFDTVFAYESHYNSLHRFLCAQCSKHLPSAHLLDLHLSETHDSFFAVQAEKKPMYACYLEECQHKSQTSADRHDHCIIQHKFPHDFRFDGFNHKKVMINSIKQHNSQHNTNINTNNNSNKRVDKKPIASSIVQASKFVAVNQVHDEDIVLEDKSILLMAQRKPHTTFSFGHRKAKTFSSAANGDDKSYAKALTKKTKQPKKTATTSTLECEQMIEDLVESLPQ